jgi:hypothetical protein
MALFDEYHTFPAKPKNDHKCRGGYALMTKTPFLKTRVISKLNEFFWV